MTLGMGVMVFRDETALSCSLLFSKQVEVNFVRI